MIFELQLEHKHPQPRCILKRERRNKEPYNYVTRLEGMLLEGRRLPYARRPGRCSLPGLLTSFKFVREVRFTESE